MKPKRVVLFLLVVLLSLAGSAQSKYRDDFREFWTDLRDNYAYFEQQGINWDRVKEIYSPLADTVTTKTGFIRLLEQVVNELHNGHVSLNTNLSSSNRIIPSGADVFVEKKGAQWVITDVREGSAAALCGLKPGLRILAFNGKPVDEQLIAFLTRYTDSYNDAMYAYAVNMLLAGTHDKAREIAVAQDGKRTVFYPDSCRAQQSEVKLEVKKLSSSVAYLRINNSLGDDALIPAFDAAIDSLLNASCIVLDLTETPGGGNTAVARAIMGRFITREMPYQVHVIDEKGTGTVRKWVEYVLPRKKPFKNKLVVMVGHWTGSMGEGLAIGFDAMKRATIVGTRMAGLLGAVSSFRTRQTNIGFQVPTEKLYHVNGTPREDFVPAVRTRNFTETKQAAFRLANQR